MPSRRLEHHEGYRTRRRRVRASGRLVSSIREQLRARTRDILLAALDQLEADSLVSHNNPCTRGYARDPLDRTREVLERDRALCASLPQEAAPSVGAGPAGPKVAPTAQPAEPLETECPEPIRTRTMAKLLASQGETDRALSIYTYLLARDGPDESLQAEIVTLHEAAQSPDTQGHEQAVQDACHRQDRT